MKLRLTVKRKSKKMKELQATLEAVDLDKMRIELAVVLKTHDDMVKQTEYWRKQNLLFRAKNEELLKETTEMIVTTQWMIQKVMSQKVMIEKK